MLLLDAPIDADGRDRDGADAGDRADAVGGSDDGPGESDSARRVAGGYALLVVIDKLPFPRRGDPLMDARREAAQAGGGNAFARVDIPHTAMLLAQGAGDCCVASTTSASSR